MDAAPVGKLLYQINIAACPDELYRFYHIWTVQGFKDAQLTDDCFPPLFVFGGIVRTKVVFDGGDLCGVYGVGVLVEELVDFGLGARAEFLAESVIATNFTALESPNLSLFVHYF